MPTTFDFKTELEFSESISTGPDPIQTLVEVFPYATHIERASEDDDRAGTDYWIHRDGLPPLSVDLKLRRSDPFERWGVDDVLLETTSVYRGPGPPYDDRFRLKPGWTLAPKRTDFILYAWLTLDGGARYWLVSYPMLNAAANRHWRAWAQRYRERATENVSYRTLWIPVPRKEVNAAIEALSSGYVT